jgi:hypothetical protein
MRFALQTLGDPAPIIFSGAAAFGLCIAVSFIATFTQRFFARYADGCARPCVSQ